MMAEGAVHIGFKEETPGENRGFGVSSRHFAGGSTCQGKWGVEPRVCAIIILREGGRG
jgi:hypothetical protein